jgi:general secretion pathway protein F
MRYLVRAFRGSDGVVSLPFDANNEVEARQQAETQGYTILSVKPGAAFGLWGMKRRTHFPLALFSQELIALLDAGLTLVESIETLAEKENNGDTKAILDQVIGHLYQGRTFSYAIEQLPLSFPALYVATVRASEKTGDLQDALTRYVAYQGQLEVVRKKLVSASIYPVILLVVGGLVIAFLMTYVVPRFSRVYEDMGGDLPFLSKLLLDWGKLLESKGLYVLIGFAALLAGIVYLLTHPGFKRWFGQLMWSIPAVGERMRLYQLARFYRTLGMLLRGGTPIVPALDMASGLLHPTLRASLKPATQAIREGRSTSDAMDEYNLTTPVALRMLRVGERTGNIGDMMERISAFYDDEIALWVDKFTKLFEPLLMAAIGIVIGMIVVLMYMPIFELAGSIK